MPKLSNRGSKKDKHKNNKKGLSFLSKKKEKKIDTDIVDIVDDEIVDADNFVDNVELSEEKIISSVVEPFQNGIVNNKLDGIVVIPRRGGQDIDFIKSFLLYFSVSGKMDVGTIYRKNSFMKKKGGMLL